MPEAQTLLTVSEPISSGTPAASVTWRDGMWPGAGLDHLADHGVVDVAGLDAGALEGRRGGDDAQLHGRARRRGRLQGGQTGCAQRRE